MKPNPTAWRTVFLTSTGLFIGLAVTVHLTGIFSWERTAYEWVQRQLSPSMVTSFSWLARFGSETYIFPAGLLILAILPGHLLRRWWLWAAVVVGATWLEAVAKELVGRPRPVGLRPGFPSGHTTAAAAFYVVLGYLGGTTVERRSFQWVLWAFVALTVSLVGVSRLVLRAHWPLDVVGGAALGVALASAAAWWHESHPSPQRPTHSRAAGP